MEKLKFAVIGCGNIGKRHIAELKRNPDVCIVSLCDTDMGKIPEHEHTGIQLYKDYLTMLHETDAEVVSICTPHNLHAEMAVATADAGKHVLVEKPMALSSADCLQMIRAAENNRVHLNVVMQNRYNKPVLHAQRAIQDNWLGKIYLFQCNVLWSRNESYYRDSEWRGKKSSEGGALFTQASHFVDMMCWLFGSVVSANPLVTTRSHHIEFEDCGAASLKFDSGVIGTCLWTTCVHGGNFEGSLTIIGEKGTIRIGGQYLNKMEYWDVQDHPLTTIENAVDKQNEYGSYSGSSSNHHIVFEQFVARIKDRDSNIVSGLEGMKTVEAIEKIYNSIDLQS